MKIKYMIKLLFIIGIGFISGKIGVRELYDLKRPFKFEKYKTAFQLEEEIKRRFPNKTDVHEAIKILNDSRARCIIKTSYESTYPYIHKGAKYIVTCSYQSDFLALNPLVKYRAIFQTDENYKIIYSGAMRVNDAFVI
ncbi:hypothetical protein NF27_AB00020 [Candidatus Jidaibacter acanthamoeba]|uniref:Uncharacterized protein n=1 Tax=Candidatus Jidaibacter acanthamoebae TaxID=86105 RepID=A0A0C1N1N7_9RICK|nr:hypothetical protein [Candidatus Jidaibacter acanthamoeba]KIE06301.1 hypothetical protein NF27_AB00020 [Candidatus Jidaibacter acanthamoeba]